MNSKFTDEQIKAYAGQFREGDAIWAGGKWNEVTENEKFGDDRITAYVPMNSLAINNGESSYGDFGSYTGFVGGFEKNENVENPYRVTTLDDYALKGGEKIVWLGESGVARTFGKVYRVNNNIEYTDDTGIGRWNPVSREWGIIPRYEQVKIDEKRDVTDEEFDNFLNELDKTLEPIKNANQLSHVVQYPTAADREEEVLKLKIFELFLEDMSDCDVIDDLKDIAIVQIRKNNYDKAIEAINAIKEWEEKK